MRKLFAYLKPYWRSAALSPFLMIGEVLCDLCLPYLMSFIVNFGILGEDIGASPVASFLIGIFYPRGGYTPLNIIILFGILMLVVTLIGGFFGTLCAYTAARASQSFGNDLRRSAYTRVMSLSIEQTDRFTTGSLVTRMTNDIAMIIEFVEMILRMFVRAPMFFVGGTIFLLTLDIKFGVVLLISLPVLLITLFLVLARAVPLFGTVQTRLDRVNCVVQENVGGARIVKASVQEDYENRRFAEANGALRSINYHVLRLMAVMTPVLILVQNLAVIAIIYIGGSNIAAGVGGMSTGNVMAAVTYTTQVITSIMMVTMMFQSVSRAMASAKRVREVLDTEPTVVGGTETAGTGADIAVSFRGVGFRYPDTAGDPVLHNVTLDVRRGETLAIVGATGSGKSSLVQMIARFYDPTEGEILVDGRPVQEYSLQALRHKIGFVLQKSELFSGTVADNVRWGRANASIAEVKEAAAVAQAAGFIEGFADDYEAAVAEKGASLSGGQKQRLSIARAVVRNPEILILDDATSALDLSTEAALQKALRTRMKDTTVIVIAQRVASVKNADRIAVIEDGTIRHCAPHEELLEISETYRDIYASQMGKGGAVQ